MPTASQLIQDLLAQTVRARQRRLFMTAADRTTLQALCSVDDMIDRNIRALSVFGTEAVDAAFRGFKATQQPAEQNAFVHVLCAIVVQMPDGPKRARMLHNCVTMYLAKHRVAVRDAFWFFPTGHSLFDARDSHLRLALESDDPVFYWLGVELVGRTGNAALAKLLPGRHPVHVAAKTMERSTQMALASAGVGLPLTQQAIQRLLAGDDRAQTHALRLIAVTGQVGVLPLRQVLALTASAHPVVQRLAWTLASLTMPRETQQHALAQTALPAAIRTRVLALTGYADGLIESIAAVVSSTSPIEGPDKDLMLLCLGQVPMEATTSTIDAPAREKALRELMLQVLRDSHIGVTNEADQGPWTAQHMLADEDKVAQVRIRGGQRKPAQGRLAPSLMGMTAVMRQALYIEHAVHYQSALALSAYDTARRQRAALGVSQGLRELFEAEDAVAEAL